MLSTTVIILSVGTILEIVGTVFELKEKIQNKKPFFKKIWVDYLFYGVKIIFIISLGVIAYNKYIEDKEDKRIQTPEGKFVDLKMTIANPVIVLGGNIIEPSILGQSIGFYSMSDVFSITNVNDELSFEIFIKNSKGDNIAQIIGREWKIYDLNSALDWNYDDTTLEITYGLNVIFQLQVGRDTAKINGMLCGTQGDCYYLTNGGLFNKAKLEGDAKFLFPYGYYVDPLFKYPRKYNLGIRNKSNK